MNTNPDDSKLALWLDDELHGGELASFEAWAASQPEQLAARAEIRRWREMLSSAIPASEEPPYADFMSSRISLAIRNESRKPAAAPGRGFSWQTLLMPFAACAGMALAFVAGTRTKPVEPGNEFAGSSRTIQLEPAVYTPESGVKAEWIPCSKASATVIVLNGVRAIPDATDFSATTATGNERESDSGSVIKPGEGSPSGL